MHLQCLHVLFFIPVTIPTELSRLQHPCVIEGEIKCCLCLEGFFKVTLCFCHGLLFYFQVKPLIWIESVIERHAHSRVEYMIKAKSQFKRRSTANNVEIVIPVPADADSPKFKTTIGSVKYAPEQNAITWTVKSFPVSYRYSYVDHKELLCRRVVAKTACPSLETLVQIADYSTMYSLNFIFCSLCISLYRVSHEECEILWESVPYVKLYRYNPKHLYPKLNGYGDNGQRSLKL